MNRAQTIVTGFDPAGPFAGLLLPPRFLKRQSETRFIQRWKLTHAQYAALMREWVGPKRQRGSVQMGAAGALAAAGSGGGSAPTVFIQAHNITDQRFSAGTARSDFGFQLNGELWSRRQVGSDTQFAQEWWSDEPETNIGNSYEARHLSAGKIGTFTTSAAVANTWITMTTTRTWGVTRTSSGNKSCTATFELGDDGAESADDSAVLTCTAIVDDM